MTGWWTLLLTPVMAFCVFLALIVVEACKDVVKEEARTRIERLPFALLHIAARRLPSEVRHQIVYEDWQPELHYIIGETDGLPITRLVRGSRYSLSLLRSSRRVGADLETVRRTPLGQDSENPAKEIGVPVRMFDAKRRNGRQLTLRYMATGSSKVEQHLQGLAIDSDPMARPGTYRSVRRANAGEMKGAIRAVYVVDVNVQPHDVDERRA